ncbi:MAG TPA: hypothetical protein VM409_03260 [Chloroflexia bacterium]|nr:hypothetical protein [Chloroflexia bacterium]
MGQSTSTVVTGAPDKPRSGSRTPLIIAGVVLGLLLLCGIGAVAIFGGIFGGVMAATQPAVDTGERFMKAISEGNYDAAFDLCAPSLKTEVGDANTLRGALETRQPVKWSFTSRNINNDLATLSGTTTYKENESGVVDMELRKVGNDWRVSYVNLK